MGMASIRVFACYALQCSSGAFWSNLKKIAMGSATSSCIICVFEYFPNKKNKSVLFWSVHILKCYLFEQNMHYPLKKIDILQNRHCWYVTGRIELDRLSWDNTNKNCFTDDRYSDIYQSGTRTQWYMLGIIKLPAPHSGLWSLH